MNIKEESHTLREWQMILANNPELMAEFEEMTSPTPIKGDISEQPVEGLEEEADKYSFMHSGFDPEDGEYDVYDHEKREAFIAGAEWQKDKMMEEAVEANLLSVEGDSYGIVSYTFQGRRFPAAFSGKCFSYKIIVIKDKK